MYELDILFVTVLIVGLFVRFVLYPFLFLICRFLPLRFIDAINYETIQAISIALFFVLTFVCFNFVLNYTLNDRGENRPSINISSPAIKTVEYNLERADTAYMRGHYDAAVLAYEDVIDDCKRLEMYEGNSKYVFTHIGYIKQEAINKLYIARIALKNFLLSSN